MGTRRPLWRLAGDEFSQRLVTKLRAQVGRLSAGRAPFGKLGTGVAAFALVATLSPPNLVSEAVSGEQLTGTYSVTLTVAKPSAFRGETIAMDWGFMCYNSACEDLTLSSQSQQSSNCVSGTCPQSPDQLTFQSAVLKPWKATFRGTFYITTGCTSSQDGTDFPYAYSQKTEVVVTPTAIAPQGSPRPVTRFTGTMQAYGEPNSIGRLQDCSAYQWTIDIKGSMQ